MFVEIWEWLRGYSKWPQAEARVEFLKEEHLYHDKDGKELHYSYVTGERLVWTGAGGEPHSAPLKLPGSKKPAEDHKYQFADGETAVIHYNPANPEEYYFRRLAEMRVRYFVTTALTVIAVAAICIGQIWIREMLGCSR